MEVTEPRLAALVARGTAIAIAGKACSTIGLKKSIQDVKKCCKYKNEEFYREIKHIQKPYWILGSVYMGPVPTGFVTFLVRASLAFPRDCLERYHLGGLIGSNWVCFRFGS